jgi:signal transduction histidine kinase
MTNLIAKIAELRKLEGRRQAIAARQHEMGTPNHSLRERLELEHEMRNAAPGMLDALGKIRAGDTEILEETIIFLNRNGHAHQDVIDMLRRLRDLARLMEDDHAT